MPEKGVPVQIAVAVRESCMLFYQGLAFSTYAIHGLVLPLPTVQPMAGLLALAAIRRCGGPRTVRLAFLFRDGTLTPRAFKYHYLFLSQCAHLLFYKDMRRGELSQ